MIGFIVQITFGGDEEEDVADTYDVARMEPMTTASTMRCRYCLWNCIE